jgi:hypothetical protein
MLPIVFLSRGVNFAAAAFASATAPRLRRIVFLAIDDDSSTDLKKRTNHEDTKARRTISTGFTGSTG